MSGWAATSTRHDNRAFGFRTTRLNPIYSRFVSVWGKVVVVLVIPLFFCLLSFLIVDTQLFRNYADPVWVRASGQIYSSRNVRCDVVIYGDSTAITGIDPSIIEGSMHLRTCNMAQTKGVLVVLGTTALDLYLRSNSRPQYLILLFSAGDFYKPQSWSDTTAYMEGVVPLLRFYPRRQFLHALFRHPEIFLGMMHYAYITGPINLWRNRFRKPTLQHRESTPIDVHFVRDVPGPVNCDLVEDLDPAFHAPDSDFIRRIRQHYSALADHLIVDASPTSTCNPRLNLLVQTLAGLPARSQLDNELKGYPPSAFNEGYAHFTKEGALRLSGVIALQIRSSSASAANAH